MQIQSIHIRHFRSIEWTTVERCGGLNIFIGKNNAGKSNILAAIDLILGHLRNGSVSGPWQVMRPRDQFTDRETSIPMQIGIEFTFSGAVNEGLREILKTETPHLERAIEELKSHETLAFVLKGVWKDPDPILFVEQIGTGKLQTINGILAIDGVQLLACSQSVAIELFTIYQQVEDLRAELRILETINRSRNQLDFAFQESRKSQRPLYLDSTIRNLITTRRAGVANRRISIPSQLEKLIESATNIEEFMLGVEEAIVETQAKVLSLEQKQTNGSITTFAGEAKIPPAYVTWIMKQYGNMPLLHITENRTPIGREEAEELLRLKVRRGGPEKLYALQQIVRALLGVSVDAFEAEGTRDERRLAEMDIDDFLVEANGAGIREALRLVLDLELKNPRLVLVEEPEVHLHPGLERAVHDYLWEKSRYIQMFVTTHSTGFVDAISFQNVYLVSRNKEKRTIVEVVEASAGPFRIPTEIGLRLSTVFIYDRLVFVEGPSDEAVIREFARRLNCDLAKANIGFVYMRGVRNFTHFAAEGTIDLLARRKIIMWFVMDRDEKNEAEIVKMINGLGGRAKLAILQRREMENYLLDPAAVTEFITEKQQGANLNVQPPTIEEVAAAIAEVALMLKDEVIRLRLEKQLASV